jgi:uncharacterized protein (UPF0305 family)
MDFKQIPGECSKLSSKNTRGELGQAITAIVLTYSPRDLQQMRGNFSDKIQDINQEYREKLEETITGYLHGTYQTLRQMHELKNFTHMRMSLSTDASDYWNMVAAQCSSAGDEQTVQLRFLKFLLAGFCMFVQGLPGHPVGMPFPGGDKVEIIDGVYHCPVREKANDVDAALCPFCPALQTPEIGYLKPPLNASKHRKQEFIQNCYDYHNFNG